MKTVIQLAREIWGENAILPIQDLERFAQLLTAQKDTYMVEKTGYLDINVLIDNFVKLKQETFAEIERLTKELDEELRTRDELLNAQGAPERAQAIIDTLNAEAGELRKDAERLDWLDIAENRGQGLLVFKLAKTWYSRAIYSSETIKRKNLRDAIDAAREQKK